MPLIEMRNVCKTFRSGNIVREVLKDVNLSVAEGEFISVVGFTGSGKSTFLNIASGLLMPDSGSVTIDGKDVRSPSAGVRCAAELLTASLVLGIRECPSCGKHPVPSLASEKAAAACREVFGSRWTLCRVAPPAQPALRRNASAGGDCAGVCDPAVDTIFG